MLRGMSETTFSRPSLVWVGLTTAAVLTTGLFNVASAFDHEEARTIALYQRLAPATVFLNAFYVSDHPRETPPATGIGAGFILDADGTVLTNAHVVVGAQRVTAILYSGARVEAQILGIDPTVDLAVVRLRDVREKVTTVRLGDSDELKVGQKTFIVGSPFGLGFTLTTGIISSLGPRPGAGSPWAAPLIQTTAPVNPGNSGGPVVDSEGRVIGITTATLPGAQNVGFAVPINTAKTVLRELQETGRIVRPWLGVGGKFVTEEISLLFALPMRTGLLVEDVEEHSPAAEAGLRAGTLDVVVEGAHWILGGDIVLSVAAQPTGSYEAFVKVMRTLQIGQTVTVEFLRNGDRHRAAVVITERPVRPSKTGELPGDATSKRGSRVVRGMDRDPFVIF